MHLRYLLSICFLCLLCAPVAWAQDTDLKKAGLKGEVMLVTESNSLSYILRGKNMLSFSVISYKYNQLGNLKEKHLRSYSADSPASRMIEIDTTGPMRLPVLHTLNDTMETTTFYIYNARGLLVRQEEYRTTDSAPARTVDYTYDIKGNRVTELHTDNQNRSYQTQKLFKMEYDKTGRLKEKATLLASEGSVFEEKERERFSYDNNDNLVEKLYFDYDTGKYWLEYRAIYDKKGRMTEQSYFHPDGTAWRKHVYDAAGNAIDPLTGQPERGCSHLNPDVQGNYLESVCPAYAEGVSTSKTVRVIEYYP